MTTREKLDADLKDAMRAGETLRRDTLRMLLAQLKNKRIALGQEPDEAQTIAVLQSAVKSRRDSAKQYRDGGRPELAEKEEAEIAVIEVYLPKMLSEEEVQALVEKTIAELGITSKKDIGKLMKAIMADYRGRLDGGMVQRAAGSLLE